MIQARHLAGVISVIDTSKIIHEFGSSVSSTTTWTATDNGYLCGKCYNNSNVSGAAWVTIDGQMVAGMPYNSATNMVQIGFCVPVAKGQVVVLNCDQGRFQDARVLGVKYVTS